METFQVSPVGGVQWGWLSLWSKFAHDRLSCTIQIFNKIQVYKQYALFIFSVTIWTLPWHDLLEAGGCHSGLGSGFLCVTSRGIITQSHHWGPMKVLFLLSRVNVRKPLSILRKNLMRHEQFSDWVWNLWEQTVATLKQLTTWNSYINVRSSCRHFFGLVFSAFPLI